MQRQANAAATGGKMPWSQAAALAWRTCWVFYANSTNYVWLPMAIVYGFFAKDDSMWMRAMGLVWGISIGVTTAGVTWSTHDLRLLGLDLGAARRVYAVSSVIAAIPALAIFALIGFSANAPALGSLVAYSGTVTIVLVAVSGFPRRSKWRGVGEKPKRGWRGRRSADAESAQAGDEYAEERDEGHGGGEAADREPFPGLGGAEYLRRRILCQETDRSGVKFWGGVVITALLAALLIYVISGTSVGPAGSAAVFWVIVGTQGVSVVGARDGFNEWLVISGDRASWLSVWNARLLWRSFAVLLMGVVAGLMFLALYALGIGGAWLDPVMDRLREQPMIGAMAVIVLCGLSLVASGLSKGVVVMWIRIRNKLYQVLAWVLTPIVFGVVLGAGGWLLGDDALANNGAPLAAAVVAGGVLVEIAGRMILRKNLRKMDLAPESQEERELLSRKMDED